LRDQLGAYGYRLLDALAGKDAPAGAVALPAVALRVEPIGMENPGPVPVAYVQPG